MGPPDLSAFSAPDSSQLCRPRKKLHTVRETLRALRDYLRQIFLFDWLPDHRELVKEHLLLKGFLFEPKLTK